MAKGIRQIVFGGYMIVEIVAREQIAWLLALALRATTPWQPCGSQSNGEESSEDNYLAGEHKAN